MKKGFLILFFSFLFFTFNSKSVYGFSKQSFLSLTIPVRELTGSNQATTDLPDLIYKLSTPSATPITWLLQYDSVQSASTSAFFESLQGSHQELGLLLEVTPKLLVSAALPSPDRQISYQANRLLLNAYPPADRQKILDQAFADFFKRFGFYPQTIGGSYLDSWTLEYLRHKYTIKTAILDVFPDTSAGSASIPQSVSTQGVFGFWPYFPSRLNTLIPAQNQSQKIPITILHWNPIDPGDGQRLNLHRQLALLPQKNGFEDLFGRFAQKDLNEFTFLSLGADNSTPVPIYLPVIRRLFFALESVRDKYTLSGITLGQFGEWLLERYPLTSPAYFYKTVSDNQIQMWYHNPFYQVHLSSDGNTATLESLTIFNPNMTEDFRFDYNRAVRLDLVVPGFNHLAGIDFDLNKSQARNEYWDLILTLPDKSLRFDVHQIITRGFDLKLPPSPQITTASSQAETIYTINSQWRPFDLTFREKILNFLKLGLIIVLLLFIMRPPPQIKDFLKTHKTVLLIILIGAALQSVTMIKSGRWCDYGLCFWGPNGHDAFVHLALENSFQKHLWPLTNPTFASAPLFNYHILFDYLTALLSRFLNVPLLDLYFRYLPILMSMGIGLLALLLMKVWKKQTSSICWTLILIYLGGSWGFVFNLFRTHRLWGGESLFWSTQAISTLINPPLAFSLIIFLVFLLLFARWQAQLTLKRVIVLALVGALLIQAKAYAAAILGLGLAILSLQSFVSKDRRFRQLFLLTGLLAGFSFLLFLPTYRQGSNLFVISPFWFIKAMIDSPDRLGWQRAANAWQFYESQHLVIKLALLQSVGLFIFFLGNLGLRVLGIRDMFSKLRSQDFSLSLISWCILIGLLIPLVVVQTSNPWNSIQFMYYSLFFLSFFAGPTVAVWLFTRQNLISFSAVLMVVVLGILPTTWGTLQDYFSPTPAAYISPSELRVLDTLEHLPKGLVVAPNFNLDQARVFLEPKPIFAYTSTAYISALSGQPTYLSDEINLAISGYDYTASKRDVNRFFNTTDTVWQKHFLKENNIGYIYQTPDQLQVDPRTINLYPINESPMVSLYGVKL